MITTSDSFYTYDLGKYYTIIPSTPRWELTEFIQKFKAEKVAPEFSYNSGENIDWLSVDDLRVLIKKHVESESE